MKTTVQKQNAYTPLIDALNEYSEEPKTIMHMPGHKAGKGYDEAFSNRLSCYDLTEIPGLDNLHHPEGVLQKSMTACAKSFGALHTFYLLNGSSSGIHMMLLSSFIRGDWVLVSRNCHSSVIHGLILFGLNPVFVMPRFDQNWQLSLPPSFEDWERALHNYPQVKGALVTSPDYYGLNVNLTPLSKMLHDVGKILLVDEAHGAHYAFAHSFPETALRQGADLCVQSLHKTMPAFTQAALLHIGSDRIPVQRVQKAFSMLTTTSPSYMILASMDYCRDFAEREGKAVYERLLLQLKHLKEQLASMQKLRLLPDMLDHYKRDPSRLVINTARASITGYQLYDLLYERYHIVAEMADEDHVVFIVTPSDSEREIKALEQALLALDSQVSLGEGAIGSYVYNETQTCAMPEASEFLNAFEQLPLKEAVGCKSAVTVTTYPPGVPLLCPGETITQEHVAHLDKLLALGIKIYGLSGDGTKMDVLR